MTHSPDPGPADFRPRKRRTWLWTVAAVVIGLCILVPLVVLMRTASPPAAPALDPAAVRQRQELLQLGAALRNYARENAGALPEQISADIPLREGPGNPLDARSRGASDAITYRIVTPAGERLRYEPFGERFVAWTAPDDAGHVMVLLNSLDEVARADHAQLDREGQYVPISGGLNRIRDMELADDGAGAGAAEDASAEDTPASATNGS